MAGLIYWAVTALPVALGAGCDSGLGLIQKSPLVRKIDQAAASSETFVPVDGGVNRACRGASTGDNKAEYFKVLSAEDLGGCKTLCLQTTGCVGLEYHVSGRCEVWTRPGGIQASIPANDYTCLKIGVEDFLLVDGGLDRACRGANQEDNNPNHYAVETGLSLEQCKQRCRDSSACVGVEHSGDRCELWSHDIEASVALSGSTCLKLEFSVVGLDHACRGADESDNRASYYQVLGPISPEECKQQCRTTSACVGVEFINTRCELWTRPEGIGAAKAAEGYTCLRYHGTHRNAPPSTKQERDARFLIQASFGPTRASLKELSNQSYESWIQQQMALPPSSLRVYYRTRVNPRPVRKASDMDSGRPLSRCATGSRWVNHVILKTDEYRKIKVKSNKIYVDDLFRSDVDPNYLGNGLRMPLSCSDEAPKGWQDEGRTCTSRLDLVERECTKDSVWVEDQYCKQSCFDLGLGYDGDDCSAGWASMDYEGYICRVKGAHGTVGGWLKLSTSSSCSGSFTAMLNPGVWKLSPDSSITQQLSFDVFRPGVLLLKEPPAQCNLGTIIQSSVEKTGQFYMLEERLELVENTLENPAASGVTGGKCPTVARTFLNEHSCRLLPGCLPLGQEALAVQLTSANLAKFYTVGGRYVYEVAGLKTTESPCNKASRWKQLSCSPCTASDLDMAQAEKIQTALAQESGAFRDVDVSCSNVTAESVVQVGELYFQHTHLDEGSVFDFTDWVLQHPGGPDKIKQFTSQGYKLIFPSWHPMERWDSGLGSEVISPNLVGKMGSSVLFHNLPQPLQTDAIAAALGANTDQQEFSQVCGSPGEVPNDPMMGHQLSFKHGAPDDWHFDSDYSFWWNRDRRAKSAVWTMQALYAPDQLRQRMAWALSQIYVCSSNGAGYDERAESWLAYYDIFVRNAFGNLRDVIREVTYNPIMGDYLTYKRNRALDETGRFPDENYAREVMQLFTIGLWKLNPDGTRVLDANGEAIPTYGNEAIMDFARVFTGFDEQNDRGNLEYVDGRNRIDPMRMKVDWHDRYPKPDLDGGYLGDGYPLCSDLAPRSFLSKGARYNFVGKDVNGYLEGEGALNLSSSSPLYQALCFASNGKCGYNLTVELSQSLQCTGAECTTHNVKKVTVDGGLCEYLEPVCVNLFFFNGRITRDGGRRWGWSQKCRDPTALIAGVACCDGCKNRTTGWMDRRGYTCENAETTWPDMFVTNCNNGSDSWLDNKYCQLACWQKGVGYEGDDCSYGPWEGKRVCNYKEERVRLSTAEQVCKAQGMQLCNQKLEGYGCWYDEMAVWTQETCSYEVLVHGDGMVSSNWTSKTRQNRFRVNWKEGRFPTVQSSCGGCQVSGDVCSCSMTEKLRAVFTTMPTSAQVVTLKMGAHPPSSPCTECDGPVRAYLQDGKYDEYTVFEHQGKFYSNKESVVELPGFEFRNPPVFLPTVYAEPRQALAEVESLIDHLFHHPNTAPFISYRLIQRLVTSNPSPAYVQAVALAFTTGQYGGKMYSGKYGDLGAATAAIFLHSEARSPTLVSDGALREPLLKFIHIMRSLEYKDHENRMVILRNLEDRIGQFPFRHPSVFSYYLPDFKPDAFPDAMVSPEFQILTAPNIISFVNGVSALIDDGLSECDKGFGEYEPRCSYGKLQLGEQDCIQPSLDELDLLLTGGRLHDKALLRAAYDEAAGADRFKVAQKAVILSPEFNVMGHSFPMSPRPPKPVEVLPEPQDYKAVIMVFLNGGMDSFNVLVPMDCPLYDEYKTVRKNVALDAGELLSITATGQPCSSFGIHPELDVFKELYDSKELAFAANVGSLVEPLDKASYREGTGARCVGLFSHSDQQRAAQTLTCQSATAASKGAGGRLADALAAGSQKLRTMSSLAGSQEWPKGMDTTPNIISNGEPDGIRKLQQLQVVIDNITSIRHGNIYAEEYNQQVAAAVAFNAELRKSLRSADLQTSFSTDSKDLTKQLKEVARLISTRAQRKVDRDIFFVQIGGFDNHQSLERNLARRLDDVNHGYRRFVAEMKAQNIFDKIVMVTHSDFARTLTPNSNSGSDHAWAGNYMVVGGGVKGGEIFNEFPRSLLPGAEQDAGRGRLIPKYPFESFMMPVAEWMGLEAAQAGQVFPNIGNFNSSVLISRTKLFN